ncbi:hypothetical protein Sta7437_0721 [Stanieria cyanosphaera PCC 7437]|uniref:Myosin heavy chain n=1 Tax=Stanieria cyanosphaera (strain ATCC 29371 / PCC 7437) TaxID=111780 RepID=K9XNX4_STAC7|nr:hypothetical protein [Stanieria cyanosphaera]AFZ34315.1 hypothetical protein Sta7437_0721 [Stanieria cyanosphaera PCC 7437]
MTINSKSTKAEILQAYKILEKDKKALESEIKKATSNSSAVIKENHPINQTKATLSSKNMEQTIKILEKLQTDFGSSVGSFSEQLVAEAISFQTIQESIFTEKQQLEELYQLTEINEDTINDLIKTYQISAKQFVEELTQQQENIEQEIESLKQAWAKEKEIFTRTIKERNENYQKTKQREAEEYQYNLDLQRDLDEEQYEQQKKHLYQELTTARLQLEKQWQQREEIITQQEQEYTEAKNKVATFEEELRIKIKQAEEEGKGIGNYQAKIKADLRTKEIEGQTKNYQLRIQTLEQTIHNQELRIDKLSQQLDLALKQVQDLAVKAIEGTSNRKSFEAMKEIALEQIKNQPKSK